jgi:hypothetical protein
MPTRHHRGYESDRGSAGKLEEAAISICITASMLGLVNDIELANR